jgi:hypothetical protein
MGLGRVPGRGRTPTSLVGDGRVRLSNQHAQTRDPIGYDLDIHLNSRSLEDENRKNSSSFLL